MGCVGKLGCQCAECRKIRGDADKPFDYGDVDYEDHTTISVSIEKECRLQASTGVDTKAGIATLKRAANEIESLREQLKQALETIEIANSEFNQCSDVLNNFERYSEFLESKLEDVLDDALRYRWMRDVGQDKLEVFIFDATNNCPNNFATWHGFTDMNSAIDKAMISNPIKRVKND